MLFARWTCCPCIDNAFLLCCINLTANESVVQSEVKVITNKHKSGMHIKSDFSVDFLGGGARSMLSPSRNIGGTCPSSPHNRGPWYAKSVVINLYIKFEFSVFTRCRVTQWVPKLKVGHTTKAAYYFTQNCTFWTVHFVVNSCTKFTICSFSCCIDRGGKV